MNARLKARLYSAGILPATASPALNVPPDPCVPSESQAGEGGKTIPEEEHDDVMAYVVRTVTGGGR